MGLYPIEVAAEELYATSATRKHLLGATAIFNTTNGPVEAVYVRWNNATSIAAGHFVAHGATPWHVNTAAYAVTNPPTMGMQGVGMLVASYPASSTEVRYGWAARRGPVTGVNIAVTVASNNHNGVLYAIQAGSANALSVVSTLDTSPTSFFLRGLLVGIGGGATNTIATTGGAGPAFINLFWR